MQKRNIVIEKTARYFLLNEAAAQAEELWIVCHGYAQLADEFLQSFQSIASSNCIVVAPEGLHRFYPKGSSGRVAASWMTKEERLDDIRDYILFLNQLYAEVRAMYASVKRVRVLGFSQGATTASRWVNAGGVEVDELILWCGFFPPDLGTPHFSAQQKLTVVTATNDRFISKEDALNQLEQMRKTNPDLHHIEFEGEHVLDESTLQQVAAR